MDVMEMMLRSYPICGMMMTDVMMLTLTKPTLILLTPGRLWIMSRPMFAYPIPLAVQLLLLAVHSLDSSR